MDIKIYQSCSLQLWSQMTIELDHIFSHSWLTFQTQSWCSMIDYISLHTIIWFQDLITSLDLRFSLRGCRGHTRWHISNTLPAHLSLLCNLIWRHVAISNHRIKLLAINSMAGNIFLKVASLEILNNRPRCSCPGSEPVRQLDGKSQWLASGAVNFLTMLYLLCVPLTGKGHEFDEV